MLNKCMRLSENSLSKNRRLQGWFLSWLSSVRTQTGMRAHPRKTLWLAISTQPQPRKVRPLTLFPILYERKSETWTLMVGSNVTNRILASYPDFSICLRLLLICGPLSFSFWHSGSWTCTMWALSLGPFGYLSSKMLWPLAFWHLPDPLLLRQGGILTGKE